MTKRLYYIDCITNLHVGSGDINYNIIDKEVEKDPITGDPVIHASGIKGALRIWAEKKLGETEINKIFGAPCKSESNESAGTHRYFNAHILCRPMRACGCASVKVTTVDTLKSFLDTANAFGFSVGLTADDLKEIENIPFEGAEFLVSDSRITTVEGEQVRKLEDCDAVNKIKGVLGGEFAIAKGFADYDLPVIARNNLRIKSGGLWYEEYVPRGSRFYFIVLAEGDIAAIPTADELIQIGGNASIGYGFCRFTGVC